MRLELYIGHNIKDEEDKLTNDHIIAKTADTLGIDALTAYDAMGVWRGEIEKTTVIVICGLTRETAQALIAKIPKLAQALNQKTIYRSLIEASDAEEQASKTSIVRGVHVCGPR